MITYLISEYKSFTNFLLDKKPHINSNNTYFKVIIFTYSGQLLGILAGLFLLFILTYSGLPESVNDVTKEFQDLYSKTSFQQHNILKHISKYTLFIFIAPIFEELSFRYSLIFKRYSLAVSWASIIILGTITSKVAVYNLISGRYLEFINRNINLLLVYFSLLIIVVLFLCLLSDIRIEKIKKFWRKKLSFFVIAFSIAFALTHSSLPFKLVNIPWIVAGISPKFFAALLYSFLRIKYGLSYSIIAHISWNALLLVPVILKYLYFS